MTRLRHFESLADESFTVENTDSCTVYSLYSVQLYSYSTVPVPRLRGRGGRRPRVAHRLQLQFAERGVPVRTSEPSHGSGATAWVAGIPAAGAGAGAGAASVRARWARRRAAFCAAAAVAAAVRGRRTGDSSSPSPSVRLRSDESSDTSVAVLDSASASASASNSVAVVLRFL